MADVDLLNDFEQVQEPVSSSGGDMAEEDRYDPKTTDLLGDFGGGADTTQSQSSSSGMDRGIDDLVNFAMTSSSVQDIPETKVTESTPPREPLDHFSEPVKEEEQPESVAAVSAQDDGEIECDGLMGLPGAVAMGNLLKNVDPRDEAISSSTNVESDKAASDTIAQPTPKQDYTQASVAGSSASNGADEPVAGENEQKDQDAYSSDSGSSYEEDSIEDSPGDEADDADSEESDTGSSKSEDLDGGTDEDQADIPESEEAAREDTEEVLYQESPDQEQYKHEVNNDYGNEDYGAENSDGQEEVEHHSQEEYDNNGSESQYGDEGEPFVEQAQANQAQEGMVPQSFIVDDKEEEEDHSGEEDNKAEEEYEYSGSDGEHDNNDELEKDSIEDAEDYSNKLHIDEDASLLADQGVDQEQEKVIGEADEQLVDQGNIEELASVEGHSPNVSADDDSLNSSASSEEESESDGEGEMEFESQEPIPESAWDVSPLVANPQEKRPRLASVPEEEESHSKVAKVTEDIDVEIKEKDETEEEALMASGSGLYEDDFAGEMIIHESFEQPVRNDDIAEIEAEQSPVAQVCPPANLDGIPGYSYNAASVQTPDEDNLNNNSLVNLAEAAQEQEDDSVPPSDPASSNLGGIPFRAGPLYESPEKMVTPEFMSPIETGPATLFYVEDPLIEKDLEVYDDEAKDLEMEKECYVKEFEVQEDITVLNQQQVESIPQGFEPDLYVQKERREDEDTDHVRGIIEPSQTEVCEEETTLNEGNEMNEKISLMEMLQEEPMTEQAMEDFEDLRVEKLDELEEAENLVVTTETEDLNAEDETTFNYGKEEMLAAPEVDQVQPEVVGKVVVIDKPLLCEPAEIVRKEKRQEVLEQLTQVEEKLDISDIPCGQEEGITVKQANEQVESLQNIDDNAVKQDECVEVVKGEKLEILSEEDQEATVEETVEELKKEETMRQQMVQRGVLILELTLTQVLELVYWKDIKKTGIVFGTMMFILLSLACFTLLSVIAYLSLAVLTVTFTFRVYKNVMQAVQKSSGDHPFKKLMEMDVELSDEVVKKAADNIARHMNNCSQELRRLYLVGDYVDSLKFGLLLWVLTYIGAWFNGMTLIILAVVSIFTLPKVYDTYKVQIDSYINLVRGQLNKIMAQITSKIPFPKKKAKTQ